MNIAGYNFSIEKWPEIKTSPALGKWKKLANGYPSARDFGIERDVYETKILVKEVPSVLDSFQNVLEQNQTEIFLSNFNSAEIIFGADVNYSGSINASVTNFGMRKNFKNDAIYELEIDLRAINPPFLETEPSLSGLNLQEGFSGDRSTEITKLFSYNNTPSYLKRTSNAGTFSANFLQNTEQMKAIRAYLLKVARANSIPFPRLFKTPFYPFGANEPDSRFQKCKVLNWSDKMVGYNLWSLQIVFAQDLPYFSAGSIDNTSEPVFYGFPPDDNSAFYATPE